MDLVFVLVDEILPGFGAAGGGGAGTLDEMAVGGSEAVGGVEPGQHGLFGDVQHLS